MQTEIRIRVGLGIPGYFREPGARHHDACRGYRFLIERLEAGHVNGMRESKVVCVEDQELGIGRISQPLGDSLLLG